ncbi:MAG: MlaD family protein [Gordonia amarae]
MTRQPPARRGSARRAEDRRRELWWGLSLVALVVVVLTATGLIYVTTPTKRDVTVQFTEAVSVKAGDRVRVAGVDVGSVRSVTLRKDRVDVVLAVPRSLRVGGESSVAVKMLTLVGGNFVDLVPAGDEPLRGGIPPERTSVPYSLANTFQQAGRKLAELDGKALNSLLTELQSGLRTPSGAMGDSLAVASRMVTNLGRREADFGKMLDVTSDYLKAMDKNGDLLTDAARKLSAFMVDYTDYYGQFNHFLESLTQILERLAPLAAIYDSDIAPLVAQLKQIGTRFRPIIERHQPLVDESSRILTALRESVQPDGSILLDQRDLVLASDYCIPLVGVRC